MKISDIQGVLNAARTFAYAANISSTAAKKLEDLCTGFDYFRDMDISEYFILMKQADSYRKDGILPVAAASKKKGSKAKETNPAVNYEHLLKQLIDLYAEVHQENVGFGAIDEICGVINGLNKDEVVKMASDFGMKVNRSTTKKNALDAIKRKLEGQKESAQRTSSIG